MRHADLLHHEDSKLTQVHLLLARLCEARLSLLPCRLDGLKVKRHVLFRQSRLQFPEPRHSVARERRVQHGLRAERIGELLLRNGTVAVLVEGAHKRLREGRHVLRVAPRAVHKAVEFLDAHVPVAVVVKDGKQKVELLPDAACHELGEAEGKFLRVDVARVVLVERQEKLGHVVAVLELGKFADHQLLKLRARERAEAPGLRLELALQLGQIRKRELWLALEQLDDVLARDVDVVGGDYARLHG
mmetsp:Transcript_11671/g.40864  ORF Transcript_11671/g.40864 Transcript_11671/m.40864 type:complete len:245 (-) Transcript_11671:1186-1920(-)